MARGGGRGGHDELADVLAEERLVDLTQPLGPETLLWPGSPPFEAELLGDPDGDDGWYRRLSLSEHSGTHLDAPGHFSPGGATAADLELSTLVRPAAVLDVRDRCRDDPRFAVSRADVEEHEEAHGRIPPQSAVLVYTGWDAYLSDRDRYAGAAGMLEFPGVGAPAARLLVERGAAGIGIDTLGVDAGHEVDFPAHRVTQPAGLWHLEGLVRLDRLPPRGAWVVVGALPLVGGSGCPVRAFAILPSAPEAA